jgi:hypothetical protein
MSGDFLEAMAASSAERAAAIGTIGDAELDKPLVPLRLGEFDVIAEIKDRSPAEGDLADTAVGRAERACHYLQGGAAAISVLTEPSRFAGSLQHLEEVAAAVPELPVMRKDFLVEPGQVLEARRAGASGVLLIVAMLPGRARTSGAARRSFATTGSSAVRRPVSCCSASTRATCARCTSTRIDCKSWLRSCRRDSAWPKAACTSRRTLPKWRGSATGWRWSARP